MSITNLIVQHNMATNSLFRALINRDWDNFKESKKTLDQIEVELSQYHVDKIIEDRTDE